MSVLIAIPVARFSCRVIIETSRAWSVVDEALLLAITRRPATMRALAESLSLPYQVVVASLSRLMRFRLVEVALTDEGSAFQLSPFGQRSVTSGNPLPVFPKRSSKRVSFVVDYATGDFFPAAQVRIVTARGLEKEADAGAEIRFVTVDGGGPSLDQEANLARLTEIAARGWDEQVAAVDSRTASLREDDFMVFRVVDGAVANIPEKAGQPLRRLIAEAAARPAGTRKVAVTYAGLGEAPLELAATHDCDFRPEDLVIGGAAHRDCLGEMLDRAHRRMIIHSTFLDAKRFDVLLPKIREACERGVRFDILWGDNDDEENPTRSTLDSIPIYERIHKDPELRGAIRFHLNSTGSHAKILLLDTEHDGWIAVVGSCNWFSSPFNAVEISAVLRDQHLVADVCRVLQRMAARRGVADDLAHELAITVNDLRREEPKGGPHKVSLVVGSAHEDAVARASREATRRMFVGCDRLGSTVRPGALMQGETAAERKVDVSILYTVPAGPLKKRHARALKAEAATNGVRLDQAAQTRLHGKFLAWDDNDLVVTSLNWTSGSVVADAPWNDIGVHIRAPGIAEIAHARLAAFYPDHFGIASEVGRVEASAAAV